MSCTPENVVVRRYRWGEDTPQSVYLPSNEIHVWEQSLSCSAGEIAAFGAFLSANEMARAGRFRFERDRTEYVVSRGTLRLLLAAYLGDDPRDLCFVYTRYGRPSLQLASQGTILDFNVAHSGEVALMAFSPDCRVGVDVEKVRSDFETNEVAEHFFSAAERESLRRLPEHERHEAFFRCWTRKEAFIKALGEGLSHPLDQFDVTLAPTEPARLLATRPDPIEVEHWTLWDLTISSGYAAALVAGRPTTSDRN